MKIIDIILNEASNVDKNDIKLEEKLSEWRHTSDRNREFLKCLYYYTNSAHGLNSYGDNGQQRILKAFNDQIENGWSEYPDAELYRCMNFTEWDPADDAFDFRKHDIVTNRNYLSTSTGGTARDWLYGGGGTSVHMTIETNQDGRAIVVNDWIDDFQRMRREDAENLEEIRKEFEEDGEKLEFGAFYSEEYFAIDEEFVCVDSGDDEVILAPGQTFQVVSRETETKQIGKQEKQYWEVHLKQIPNQGSLELE